MPDEFISERRPDVFIGDAVVASAVLEILEVLLSCVEEALPSGCTYVIMPIVELFRLI